MTDGVLAALLGSNWARSGLTVHGKDSKENEANEWDYCFDTW